MFLTIKSLIEPLKTFITLAEAGELPLERNFMPGYTLEKIVKNENPNPNDIKESLGGIRILHLAQNKTDVWEQILINELNSSTNQ